MTDVTRRPRALDLSPEEQSLFKQLDTRRRSEAENLDPSQAAANLFRHLQERNAIPEIRWAYFAEPEHNVGGYGTSRLGWFRRKGRKDEEIVRDRNFVKYLRYFVNGPNLPPTTIKGFCDFLDDNQPHTSGDVEELRQYARRETRAHALSVSDAAEEFYKLAIECNLPVSTATSIRACVKQIRS